jgi:hypothetical protein
MIQYNPRMNGNSAHVYNLDDGKFRLTFISASKGGGQFLSEIGDFTRLEIEDWLKDHLHPATDFATLLEPVANQTESNIPLIRGTVLRTHFEDDEGALVKSAARIEDVCQWMSEYQEQYFEDRKITVVADLPQNKQLKATACFCPTPEGGSIMVSSELLRFSNCLRISLLHELVHANLHISGKNDPNDDHGEPFKSEIKRLMNEGAYDQLL